jgi:uncharacterized protein
VKKANHYITVHLFLFIAIVGICGCSSAVFEQEPAYKNGDKYKKYRYTWTISRGRELRGWDIELYEHTPAWDLAKAVYEQDTTEIEELCKNDNKLVSIREPRFGMTLLSWAVVNSRYYSAIALLKCNADPNAKESNNVTPFSRSTGNKETSNYLKLLLKYGGNVNYIQKLDSINTFTALEQAAATNFENTKILVEAGADINYSDDSITSALSQAVIYGTIDVVAYLLEKGANFKNPVLKSDDKFIYPLDALKNDNYKKGTKEYETWLSVLKFLREHGADSSNYGEPILPK